MTLLFGRSASLTVARPLVSARGGRFGAFFEPAPNAIVIGGADADEGLRFAFKIEKNLEKEPNPAEIIIYNLSEQSRAMLQAKPLHVQLFVGYGGELQRLFVGDVQWIEQRKNGVDWETRLTVGDGSRAFRHARVNRSFRAGATLKQGIGETIAAMGLPVPRDLDALPGINTSFASGLSLSGPASGELTRLLAPTGAGWSVQDGRMQILRDTDVRKDQAVVLSSDPQGGTGLVGVPEYGAPKERGKPPVLVAKSLLDPRLTAGGLVRIESLAVKGLFKVRRVAHEGDTRGPSWYSSIEATPR